jgi:hypothetical protein
MAAIAGHLDKTALRGCAAIAPGRNDMKRFIHAFPLRADGSRRLGRRGAGECRAADRDAVAGI